MAVRTADIKPKTAMKSFAVDERKKSIQEERVLRQSVKNMVHYNVSSTTIFEIVESAIADAEVEMMK